MTDLAAVTIRLIQLAEEMRLVPEWDLTVRFDEHTDRIAYTTYDDGGYRAATIHIGPSFPEDEAEWDETLRHELAHVLVAGWSVAVREAIRELPKPLRRLARAVVDREEEAVCDRIARLPAA